MKMTSAQKELLEKAERYGTISGISMAFGFAEHAGLMAMCAAHYARLSTEVAK